MTTVVEHFLSAAFEERLGMVTAEESADDLRNYLGEDAFGEYCQLARAFDRDHLAGAAPNFVFVPGVMGSSLASTGLGGTWWLDLFSRHHIGDLRLAADGLSDADPRARIAPVSVMGAYEGFFAGAYESGDLHHLAFAYDWRKPLRASAARLRDAILGASTAAGGPVHVVAHSMGGLLTRVALMTYPSLWRHVGRMVFIGTPHFGSPAIAGYLKNHLWGMELLALLGRYLDRAAFRSLRGVLNLLPAPADVYPGAKSGGPHPCANFEMYDVDAWQLGLAGAARDQLQAALDDTAQLQRDLQRWHSEIDQDLRDRMAAIVGVGYDTLFRLAYHKGFGFHWRHMDRVKSREPGNVHREGDGRVPVASAVLTGLAEIRYVHAEHGKLPTVPAVYRDVFRFLRGQAMELPHTPAAALDEEHLSDPRGESVTPVLASFGAIPSGEDPGYLDMTEADESTLDVLDAALAAGRLPAFTRARIL
jgi:pimeloyl-ACP methyl ester carboxylesterase